jgi:predicted permease
VSLRQLVRNPRTSFVIVLCATLAIGLNSAIFNVVHAFVLRAPAVASPNELVRLYSSFPGFDYASLSYPDYADLRERSTAAFSELAAYGIRPVNLSVDGETEQVAGILATGNYFAALGVAAARGRVFTADDDRVRGGHPVAVIGDRLWQSRFGAAADVVGRKLLLNGQPFTVIGVVPPEFAGTIPGLVMDLWVPMQMQPAFMPSDADLLERRGSGWLSTFGRLAPGVSAAQAQASLDLAVAELKEAYRGDEEWSVAVHPGVSQVPPNVGVALEASSVLILVLVFCVLLIACANVASLLLARAEARRKEISIRLAMGAGRARLVRQLLTESGVLALLGGIVGTLLAVGAGRVFPALVPSFGIPVVVDVTPDATVYLFTLVVTLATGCLFGLVPALQASRPDLVTALKGEAAPRGGRRRMTLRQALVAFQVAVSVLLLVGAGLFIRSLQRERQVDPGYAMENLLLGSLDPSLYGYDKARGRLFFDELREEVASLPGVRAVTVGEIVPLTFSNSQQWGIEVEGYEPARGERMNPDYNVVGGDYFATLGIPLVEGRPFAAGDDAEGRPVIVVNRAMAERYWGGEALGRRVRLGGEWREVVGIAENVKVRSLRDEAQPYLYVPLGQVWKPAQELHVRTAGDPLAAVAAVRAALAGIDPDVPLLNVRTFAQHAEGSLFLSQMGARLIGLFGGLALLLATIGLFGLLTHAVVRRTREIGIRMSLGARGGDVFAQLLREGLKLTAIGLVAGLGAALAASRFLGSLLYGLSGADPATLTAVTAVLLASAVAAIAVPALKATRIDPVVALRYE